MLTTNAIADSKLLLGDFTQAILGVRGGLSIEFSRDADTAFAADQTWIRLLWRGDVNFGRAHFHRLEGISY
jgi:HK97 family phage major capsid protein